MNEQQLQKWEQIRKVGPWKYGLKYGIVWGTLVGMVFIFVYSIKQPDKISENIPNILIMMVIYWISGIILYRFIFWRSKEKVYQVWKKNQK